MSSSMSHTVRKLFSIALVLCVLAIGGLAQAQSAEHAGHHAHHQAATHGTLLCSWMCDAGTVLDTAGIQIQSEQGPVEVALHVHPLLVVTERSHSTASRAPPYLPS